MLYVVLEKGVQGSEVEKAAKWSKWQK